MHFSKECTGWGGEEWREGEGLMYENVLAEFVNAFGKFQIASGGRNWGI